VAFVEGLRVDHKAFGIALLGGDTVATPGPASFSMTLLGWIPRGRTVGRAGAKPGDRVFVTGVIGDGWLGLEAVQNRLSLDSERVAALSDRFHVLALDPRGQGDSEVTRFGYTHERRGQDIGELIEQAAGGPVVLVGWSLGVLDSLALVARAGDSRIAGLVLIDNSIGEEPAPRPARSPARADEPAVLSPADRRSRREAFVAGMFARDPGADWRARITAQALRMDPEDERRLLAYDVPREYWRDAVHATGRPVLYVVRPRWREQGENLIRAHANAEMVVFEDAGHALFVDEAERFNALLIDFLDRRVSGRDTAP
jgi:microsomal epoxide hydrolase